MKKTIKAYRYMQRKKGFTLVELIVILVILAILAALIIPTFIGYIRKAQEKRVIVSGRQAYLAAQTLASEGYAAAVWEDPTEEAVLELSKVKGQIVTMTFTKPGVVDATEVSPFRYQEGDIIVKFADGVWTVEEDSGSGGESGGSDSSGGESGGGESVGDESSGDGNSDGSVTVTDSAGNTYTIRPSYSWSDIQNKIVGGWNIIAGCVLSDETGTYLCSSEGNEWIKSNDAANWTVKDLVGRKPSYFIKLDSNAKIWTASDVNEGQWESEPQKGELAFYGNKFYVAPGSIGRWTFPPGGWIEIKQP